MKNIIDICKELSIEVPEEVQASFTKAVAENYKTVAEFDKKVARLESERDEYKERCTTAEDVVKGMEGVDLDAMNKEIADWKAKFEQAEQEHKDNLYKRDFADALSKEMEAYKFTSDSAKKSVMAEIEGAGLKLSEGKILGLTDLVGQIKKRDEGAFVDEAHEQAEQNKAQFTTSIHGASGSMTKEQIMAISDRGERRKAIAENMALFQN